MRKIIYPIIVGLLSLTACNQVAPTEPTKFKYSMFPKFEEDYRLECEYGWKRGDQRLPRGMHLTTPEGIDFSYHCKPAGSVKKEDIVECNMQTIWGLGDNESDRLYLPTRSTEEKAIQTCLEQ